MTTTAERPEDRDRDRRNVTYNALMSATSARLDRLERDIAAAKKAGNDALASRLADRALRMAGY